jgi:hypothetical protein
LNYAVTLFKKGELVKAKQHLLAFEQLFQQLDEDAKAADPEVLEQRQMLTAALESM